MSSNRATTGTGLRDHSSAAMSALYSGADVALANFDAAAGELVALAAVAATSAERRA